MRAPSTSRARAGAVLAGLTGGVLAGCPAIPADDTLSLRGALEREGVAETDLEKVAVDYASTSARGEWWSCDLRLTAGGCVGDHHVNVWVTLPQVTDFDGLGGVSCADDQGNVFGAYELLSTHTKNGDPIRIGPDVNVLVLLASDLDADGSADLADDAETAAASRLVDGSVEVLGIGSFDEPLAVTIQGTTPDGNALTVEMSGPTSPVPNPPALDAARTCVAGDLLD